MSGRGGGKVPGSLPARESDLSLILVPVLIFCTYECPLFCWISVSGSNMTNCSEAYRVSQGNKSRTANFCRPHGMALIQTRNYLRQRFALSLVSPYGEEDGCNHLRNLHQKFTFHQG